MKRKKQSSPAKNKKKGKTHNNSTARPRKRTGVSKAYTFTLIPANINLSNLLNTLVQTLYQEFSRTHEEKRYQQWFLSSLQTEKIECLTYFLENPVPNNPPPQKNASLQNSSAIPSDTLKLFIKTTALYLRNAFYLLIIANTEQRLHIANDLIVNWTAINRHLPTKTERLALMNTTFSSVLYQPNINALYHVYTHTQLSDSIDHFSDICFQVCLNSFSNTPAVYQKVSHYIDNTLKPYFWKRVQTSRASNTPNYDPIPLHKIKANQSIQPRPSDDDETYNLFMFEGHEHVQDQLIKANASEVDDISSLTVTNFF